MAFHLASILTVAGATGLFAFSLFYVYAKWKLSYWSRRGVKTPPTHLLFGNFADTLTLRKPPGQAIQEIYESASPDEPYVGFYIFHEPKLLVRDPKLMKQLLVKDFDVFPNRCFGGAQQKDSVGLVNLLGIHQPRWRYLRQKLTPSVTGLKMRAMVPLIKDCGAPLLGYIERSEAQPDGWKRLELKEMCSRYTTDVIASLAFGINTNSFEASSDAFYRAGQSIVAGAKRGIILMILLFLPGLIRFVEKYTDGPAAYFRTIFWDSMNAREKEGSKRGDLVDHLISLKNGEQQADFKFEGDNLVGQAVSYYVAGFEATSSSIAFSLYELSFKPECEERLYKEIVEILGDKELTVELINQMTFLDEVVNETIRMYPVLPLIDRVPVQDYKMPGSDLVIEKNVPIYVSLAGTNRDPKYYEKPNEFVPSRPRIEAEDRPSSSLSFGIGPRSCVGQRLGVLITKIGLIEILKEYTLANETKSATLLKPITIFTAAADGVNVKLKKRY